MEGSRDTTMSDAHLTSAAAFVEGGVLDSCDDSCSICLEHFSETDPSTLTSCKHEYHVQCILEWCQRSSQCPMCWQSISLKDPTSQELLEAVERERSFRLTPSRNATIFRHPTLGDFELQHLPVGVDSAEVEERIIQHLAAAAAMGRARQAARRESRRSRSSSQGHPQFMVLSSHSNASPPHAPMPSSPSNGEGFLHTNVQPTSSHPRQVASESNGSTGNQSGEMSNHRSLNHSSPSGQDRAGPSELQSFSDSLKSRLNAVSTRYKESISRNTRSWTDRFFSRNTSVADLGSEVSREVNAGIATVSRMMERLETRENSRSGTASVSDSSAISTPSESNNEHRSESGDDHTVNERSVQGVCAASSGSS